MVKKIFKNLIISTLITPIFLISISCNNNANNPTILDSKNIISAIRQNNIKISINFNGNPKINEIQESDFKFEVIETLVNEDGTIIDHESDLYKYEQALKKSLNISTIKYKGFYIPKTNDDINSSFVFEINNNSEELIEVSASRIYNKTSNLVLTNLNQEEIILIIKNKLNEDINFFNGIKYFLSTSINSKFNAFGENNITTFWSNYQIAIKQELEQYFFKKYDILFDKTYNNLFLTISAPILNSEGIIEIPNIQISTNEITNDSLSYSIGKITL